MSIIKNYQPAKGTVKVTFTYPASLAAGLKTVQVLGNFNNWDSAIAPKLKGTGDLTTVIELTAGQTYEFRYLLDGIKWDNDHHADSYVPSPFGGINNSVIVLDGPVSAKKTVATPTKSTAPMTNKASGTKSVRSVTPKATKSTKPANKVVKATAPKAAAPKATIKPAAKTPTKTATAKPAPKVATKPVTKTAAVPAPKVTKTPVAKVAVSKVAATVTPKSPNVVAKTSSKPTAPKTAKVVKGTTK